MASSEEEDVAMVIKRASFKLTPIVDACSNTECIALATFDRRVYTCDLSDASRHQKYVKVNFSTLEEDDHNDIDILSVCCGRYHYLALSAHGGVYSWGKNNYGQLGHPKKKQKHRGKDQEKQAPKPRLITDLSSYDVIQIACGDDHSLALTRDGRVFTWGSNGHGQLGIGEERRTRHHYAKPTEIYGLNRVQQIAAGGAHTVVMSASGSVYVWGRNSHGQLGLRMEQDVKRPMKLKSVQGKVKRISCGENHTSFLFENGELCIYGMGTGTHPCESCKSELSPARVDTSYLYSSLLSIGQRTFVTDESSGRPFVLNHEEVRQEPSQELQLDLLEESTLDEVFGPDALPEWPPGCDNIDVKLWKMKKSEIQDDGKHGKETFDREPGVAGNQDNNQESRRRIIVIQHEEKMGEQSQSSFSPGRKIQTLSTELLQSLRDVDDTTMEVNRSALLQDAKTVFSSPASLGASFPQTGRRTFVTDESSDRPFVLNQEEVRQHGHSRDLQLNPLEENTFDDVVGPDAPPKLPTGCDNIDVKLWKMKNNEIQDDGKPGKETLDSGPGVSGNQGNNQESRRGIIVIQHEKKMGEQSQSSFSPGRKIQTLSTELLQSLSDVDDTTMEVNRSALLQDAKTVFSSPASLGASFPQTGPPEVSGLNIDLKAARQAFELIIGKEKLLEWISKVVGTDLCRNIQRAPFLDEDLHFYFILLECPIFSYPQFEWSRRVLAAVGRLLITSDLGDVNHLNRLVRWWKFEPVSFRKTVDAYREAVHETHKKALRNVFISPLRTPEHDDFKTYLEVLKCLNQINLQQDIVPVKRFYIPDLRTDVMQKEQFRAALSRTKVPVSQGFSWLSYPFLIDLKTKAIVLDFRIMTDRENAEERETGRRELRLVFQRFRSCLSFSSYLSPVVLIVNRDDIFGTRVREQLAKMLGFPSSTVQKPLRVTFEGESGIDEGALSMEFFRLVFDKLLDPQKNDLFRYINEQDPNQSKVWFREECSSTKTARVCGLLFGLSLYNQALVPFPAFPQLLYAKLLGKGPKSEIEEIEELDKDFADQMSKLLNGSDEYVMESCYGDELELDSGERVEITKANVHLHVKKKVRHFLAPSQFAAFQQGFNKVWDTAILNIFSPVELEAYVNGEECFDWIALEKSTWYLEPYTDSHPTIKMFWEVFHALDDGMKRKFLVFVVGSDRVPIGGLTNLGLIIHKLPVQTGKSRRLSRLCPVAHCCDDDPYRRTLKLPMYNSKELIEDRLMATLSIVP